MRYISYFNVSNIKSMALTSLFTAFSLGAIGIFIPIPLIGSKLILNQNNLLNVANFKDIKFYILNKNSNFLYPSTIPPASNYLHDKLSDHSWVDKHITQEFYYTKSDFREGFQSKELEADLSRLSGVQLQIIGFDEAFIKDLLNLTSDMLLNISYYKNYYDFLSFISNEQKRVINAESSILPNLQMVIQSTKDRLIKLDDVIKNNKGTIVSNSVTQLNLTNEKNNSASSADSNEINNSVFLPLQTQLDGMKIRLKDLQGISTRSKLKIDVASHLINLIDKIKESSLETLSINIDIFQELKKIKDSFNLIEQQGIDKDNSYVDELILVTQKQYLMLKNQIEVDRRQNRLIQPIIAPIIKRIYFCLLMAFLGFFVAPLIVFARYISKYIFFNFS